MVLPTENLHKDKKISILQGFYHPECLLALKSKVRVHSGLSKEHRKQLIDEYLMRHY